MNDSSPQLSFEVERLYEEKTKRWYAFLYSFCDWLVSFIPTHRDSTKGRKNALQVKAILIACGVIIVAFAGQTWVPFGVVVMALALIAPMAEMRRRSLRSRLKRAQVKTVVRREPAKIVYDGRRVQLQDKSQKKLRRVLTNKDDHRVLKRDFEGRLAIGIKGPGGKKKEQIWLITRQPVDESLEPLSRDEIDLLIEASLDDIDQLKSALEAA